MLQGIILALSACLIWGLIFVIPQFMQGFNCFEIAIGRYFSYGLVSLAVFSFGFLRGNYRYTLWVWRKALIYSFFTTMGYYIWVILALKFASPAITTLILGISPIAIAFYGNWRKKELSNKKLILPSVFIFLGLILINAPQFQRGSISLDYFLGMGAALLALAAWSWYVVANSEFLSQHEAVDSSDWATMMGVGAMVWALLFFVGYLVFFPQYLDIAKFTTLHQNLIHFLAGSLTLGLICSWLGAYLWNRAALLLPVTLAGQITIFETIFGATFCYLVAKQLPHPLEFAGIAILLSAVIIGINTFYAKPKLDQE